MMMYKAMHGLAPAYLSELCASSCVEGRTRSSARGDFVVQRTRTKFGGRAFVVAGPAAWNRLPCSVRNSPSLDSFRTALKTFFFTPDILFVYELLFGFTALRAEYYFNLPVCTATRGHPYKLFFTRCFTDVRKKIFL